MTLTDTQRRSVGEHSATGGGTITGSGTTSLTITGSLSQVNSDLGTLSDTDGTAGSDTITVSASDSFGNSATQQTIAVTADPVNGNDSVSLSGNNHTVTLGNGNDSVSGSGTTNNDTVTLGGGNDHVSLTGNNNTASLGGGNDNVSLTGNNETASLGNGNDTVTVSGTGETITAGTGNDTFTLGASMTTLTMHGMHDTVSVNGGTDTITDTLGGGDKLQLQIGASGGTVGISNFGVANAVVSLVHALASGLGWSTPAEIAAHVTSDGHSSELSLGSHGSIDFVGVTGLTAKNFQIS